MAQEGGGSFCGQLAQQLGGKLAGPLFRHKQQLLFRCEFFCFYYATSLPISQGEKQKMAIWAGREWGMQRAPFEMGEAKKVIACYQKNDIMDKTQYKWRARC